ncbi:phenylalanine--tRNA ligase subunit alpha [Methanococcus aeolicus]|uniref:phenylalanine--tRNA ligase subunit alpha n=1 Tax=Methanococcus aeolicus TaxID=42879 RepID=UPI0021C5B992|nr:phenylalanine--tRNA ligase subunit alpha [Methanococcus aeolicus]UXM84869.1 phenylalanine--tRNA ligase subunit alpha [Methanococcus aeolicus]
MEDFKLHNDEKKLLKIFQEAYKNKNITKLSVEELAKNELMGSETKVMRTALWLSAEDKKLVNIIENKSKIAKLTEEGKKVVEKGLPERQVANYMIENDLKNIPIKELGNILDKSEVNPALGNLKKKKIAKIEKGNIIIENLQYEDKEENTLNKIKINEENKNSDLNNYNDEEKKLINNLQKRGFIAIEEEVDRAIELTEKGIEFIKNNIIEIKEEISQLTREHIVSGKWKDCHIRPYDAKIPSEEVYPAKLHPMTRIINDVKEVLIGMGFKEVKNPIVETEFWNFDVLFEPQDHPARDMQDTFFLRYPNKGEIPEMVKDIKSIHEKGMVGDKKISKGWRYEFDEEISKKTVLRTHTTVSSIKYLASLTDEEKEKPHKIFSIDRVFRNEAIDYSHLPEFYQCEGIILAEGVHFDNLIGLLKEFLNRLGFEQVRIRPAYFPFTEPSLEAEVFVEGRGWLELLGAGVFRPEVVEPLGINKPVLAWGIGLSRLAMLRWGLTDIRELHKNELNWLKKA